MDYANDIVLSLDAGGTNFVFSAISKGKIVGNIITKPSNASNLNNCLNGMVAGFDEVIASLPQKPIAISFAFPGPADYPNGVIGDLGNLPAFRGGVALGPMLEETFGVPVFINNDGDLFALGEAISGFLPKINTQLQQNANPRKYRNLLGVTLGTGFGAGFVHNGELYIGDNSAGAEIWVTRSMLKSACFAEEEISIRAIKRNFAFKTGNEKDTDLSPKEIFDIAKGAAANGNKNAALFAFSQFGTQLGDSLANAVTLLDCNVVIGGGLSNAYPLFAPAMMAQLNGKISTYSGSKVDRMEVMAYNLENELERDEFLKSTTTMINVPNSNRVVPYNSKKKVGVGLSVLGTSNAVAIGAWAFAISKL
jgi:glucokinase